MARELAGVESVRFAIVAIAISALGGRSSLTREEIAKLLERVADDLRYERL